MSDEFYIPPPNTMTVRHDHKAVLYTADGRGKSTPRGWARLRSQTRPGTHE